MTHSTITDIEEWAPQRKRSEESGFILQKEYLEVIWHTVQMLKSKFSKKFLGFKPGVRCLLWAFWGRKEKQKEEKYTCSATTQRQLITLNFLFQFKIRLEFYFFSRTKINCLSNIWRFILWFWTLTLLRVNRGGRQGKKLKWATKKKKGTRENSWRQVASFEMFFKSTAFCHV